MAAALLAVMLPAACAPTGTAGRGCERGCLRWERRCDVDPRGVYRCERVCVAVGEVCPPGPGPAPAPSTP